MSFRTTIVLAVLLVVLGGIYMFTRESADQTAAQTPDTPTTATAPLLSEALTPADVEAFAVRAGAEELRFERPTGDAVEAATWRMTSPIEAAVDAWQVDELVRRYLDLESVAILPPEAGGRDSTTAGLAEPRLSVEIVPRAAELEPIIIHVGARPALSENTYVQRDDDDQIHVVKGDLAARTDLDPLKYRSREIFNLAIGDIAELRVTDAAGTYRFEKQPDQAWRILEPVRATAETAKMREYLLQLTSLQAVDFVEDAGGLASLGLANPTLGATLTIRRNVPQPPSPDAAPDAPLTYETVEETHELVIGEAADLDETARYASIDGGATVFTVAANVADRLHPSLGELRSTRVTRVPASDITALDLDVRTATARLERAPSGWVAAGGNETYDNSAVNAYVEQLAELRAVDFVSDPARLAEYGLDAPRAVIRATVRSEDEQLVLLVGGLTGSRRNAFVKRGDDPTVFVVGAAQAEALAASPLLLRSREIVNFERERLQALTLRYPHQRYRVARDQDGTFQLEQPADGPLLLPTFMTIVGDLARLRAQRIAAEEATAAFGFDAPDVALTLALAPVSANTTTAPSTLEQIEIRVKDRGGRYFAQRSDRALVYELDQTVYAALTQEILARRVFDFPVADLQTLTVVTPEHELHFERDDDAWTYPADPFLDLQQAAVQAQLQRLAELTVTRYVQFADADLAAFALADAPNRVTATLADGRSVAVHVGPQESAQLTRLAAIPEPARVFRLDFETVNDLLAPLDAYLPDEDGVAGSASPNAPLPPRAR